MPINKQLGVIGIGNMGQALVRGWLKAGLVTPPNLWLADVEPEKVEQLQREFGVRSGSNRQVAAVAGILVLSVKPQVIPAVLAEIRDVITTPPLAISIAAGIPLSYLEQALPQARWVRVMPNTPTLVQAGMAALAAGTSATAQDLAVAEELFAAVGRTVTVPEKLLDAVTGLSGCGPAYVFLFLEALADGGVKMGLPRDTALLLAAQTLLGSAILYLQTSYHPGVLKDQVTSPGGATIAGLHVLEQGGWRGLIMSAVEAATKRSQELGQAPAMPS